MVLIIIIVVTSFLNKNKSSQNTETTVLTETTVATEESIDISQANPEGTQAISSETAFFPVLSDSDNSIIYLSGASQELIKYDILNQTSSSFPIDVPLVKAIGWSKDRTRAIIETYNSDKDETKYYYYDLVEQNLKGIKIVYNSSLWISENELLYCVSGDSASQLKVINFDSNQTSKAADLTPICDRLISYDPASKTLLYASIASDTAMSLMAYNIETKTSLTVISSNLVSVKASADNTKIIVEVSDGSASKLQVINASDLLSSDLNFYVPVNQLAWIGNENIVAFFSESGADTASFYSVDLATQTKNKLNIELASDSIPQNIILDQASNLLFYTLDDYLYQAGL